MGKKSSKDIQMLKLSTGDPNVIVVTVRYSLGGMNYFSGRSEPRGYYLSAAPETHTENCRSFMAFTGTKILLEETKRFSQKRFDDITTEQRTLDNAGRLVDSVLTKEKLYLANEEVAA